MNRKISIFIYGTLLILIAYPFISDTFLANAHEGNWQTFYYISNFLSMTMLGLLIGYVFIRDLDNVLKVIFGLFISAVFLFQAKNFYAQSYHALYESPKTVFSSQYQITKDAYRGNKFYHIHFKDDNSSNHCKQKHNDCPYTYKVRINSKTYHQLLGIHKNPSDNPLILTFKNKAQMLIKLEFAKTPS